MCMGIHVILDPGESKVCRSTTNEGVCHVAVYAVVHVKRK